LEVKDPLKSFAKTTFQGKQEKNLKSQWRELRQGTLISIGSKADKGNRLTRFESINGQLYLRITTGNREFIPLKPVLVEGAWDRVRSRLATLEVRGASR
jgi:hypothetical protein